MVKGFSPPVVGAAEVKERRKLEEKRDAAFPAPSKTPE